MKKDITKLSLKVAIIILVKKSKSSLPCLFSAVFIAFKNFLEAISAAEKKQDKEDIDFITNVIIASLTEEEVAKHIPEEGQRLLRKKLVSLMDKKLGL